MINIHCQVDSLLHCITVMDKWDWSCLNKWICWLRWSVWQSYSRLSEFTLSAWISMNFCLPGTCSSEMMLWTIISLPEVIVPHISVHHCCRLVKKSLMLLECWCFRFFIFFKIEMTHLCWIVVKLFDYTVQLCISYHKVKYCLTILNTYLLELCTVCGISNNCWIVTCYMPCPVGTLPLWLADHWSYSVQVQEIVKWLGFDAVFSGVKCRNALKISNFFVWK